MPFESLRRQIEQQHQSRMNSAEIQRQREAAQRQRLEAEQKQRIEQSRAALERTPAVELAEELAKITNGWTKVSKEKTSVEILWEYDGDSWEYESISVHGNPNGSITIGERTLNASEARDSHKVEQALERSFLKDKRDLHDSRPTY